MTNTSVTDVVVLIPGFLGFDKLGKHSYFAETVGDAISKALIKGGRSPSSIAVETVSTSPADSLATRQGELLDALEQVVKKRGADVRLHLVGHSTGGLDAELLTRQQPLQKRAWDGEEVQVRKAIHSIHTVASPLAGTTLANSPLATVFGIQSPLDAWNALESKTVFRAVAPVLRLIQGVGSLVHDRSALNVLYGAFDGSPLLGRFVLSAALRRALISNLQPSHVAKVLEAGTDPTLASIHRSRVLTIAPKSKKKSQAGRLFDLFYSSTEQAADRTQVPAFVPSLKQRVADGKISAIAGDRALLDALVSAVDPASNDAIVNTLRQVFVLEDPAQMALELDRVVAIVLADHLDVVGYFPTNDVIDRAVSSRFSSGKTTQNGFLESGAHFADTELRSLYELVALEIQKSIASEVAQRAATVQA